MRITIEQTHQTAVEASPNVMAVASMFGLGTDHTRRVVTVPKTVLDLNPGSLVFVTGPSGGGKSTVLRLINEQAVKQSCVDVIDFNSLGRLAERPLVDVLAGLVSDKDRGSHNGRDGSKLKLVFKLLSLAGLNDAFVMLRKPSQLSDGQRYRLRLAQAFAMAWRITGDEVGASQVGMLLILADEFASMLDRTTAAVIARNAHRFTRRSPEVCFIAASSHDDLLESLDPDVLIDKPLGGEIEVLARADVDRVTGQEHRSKEGSEDESQCEIDSQTPLPPASPEAGSETLNET